MERVRMETGLSFAPLPIASHPVCASDGGASQPRASTTGSCITGLDAGVAEGGMAGSAAISSTCPATVADSHSAAQPVAAAAASKGRLIQAAYVNKSLDSVSLGIQSLWTQLASPRQQQRKCTSSISPTSAATADSDVAQPSAPAGDSLSVCKGDGREGAASPGIKSWPCHFNTLASSHGGYSSCRSSLDGEHHHQEQQEQQKQEQEQPKCEAVSPAAQVGSTGDTISSSSQKQQQKGLQSKTPGVAYYRIKHIITSSSSKASSSSGSGSKGSSAASSPLALFASSSSCGNSNSGTPHSISSSNASTCGSSINSSSRSFFSVASDRISVFSSPLKRTTNTSVTPTAAAAASASAHSVRGSSNSGSTCAHLGSPLASPNRYSNSSSSNNNTNNQQQQYAFALSGAAVAASIQEEVERQEPKPHGEGSAAGSDIATLAPAAAASVIAPGTGSNGGAAAAANAITGLKTGTVAAVVSSWPLRCSSPGSPAGSSSSSCYRSTCGSEDVPASPASPAAAAGSTVVSSGETGSVDAAAAASRSAGASKWMVGRQLTPYMTSLLKPAPAAAAVAGAAAEVEVSAAAAPDAGSAAAAIAVAEGAAVKACSAAAYVDNTTNNKSSEAVSRGSPSAVFSAAAAAEEEEEEEGISKRTSYASVQSRSSNGSNGSSGGGSVNRRPARLDVRGQGAQSPGNGHNNTYTHSSLRFDSSGVSNGRSNSPTSPAAHLFGSHALRHMAASPNSRRSSRYSSCSSNGSAGSSGGGVSAGGSARPAHIIGVSSSNMRKSQQVAPASPDVAVPPSEAIAAGISAAGEGTNLRCMPTTVGESGRPLPLAAAMPNIRFKRRAAAPTVSAFATTATQAAAATEEEESTTTAAIADAAAPPAAAAAAAPLASYALIGPPALDSVGSWRVALRVTPRSLGTAATASSRRRSSGSNGGSRSSSSRTLRLLVGKQWLGVLSNRLDVIKQAEMTERSQQIKAAMAQAAAATRGEVLRRAKQLQSAVQRQQLLSRAREAMHNASLKSRAGGVATTNTSAITSSSRNGAGSGVGVLLPSCMPALQSLQKRAGKLELPAKVSAWCFASAASASAIADRYDDTDAAEAAKVLTAASAAQAGADNGNGSKSGSSGGVTTSGGVDGGSSSLRMKSQLNCLPNLTLQLKSLQPQGVAFLAGNSVTAWKMPSCFTGGAATNTPRGDDASQQQQTVLLADRQQRQQQQDEDKPLVVNAERSVCDTPQPPQAAATLLTALAAATSAWIDSVRDAARALPKLQLSGCVGCATTTATLTPRCDSQKGEGQAQMETQVAGEQQQQQQKQKQPRGLRYSSLRQKVTPVSTADAGAAEAPQPQAPSATEDAAAAAAAKDAETPSAPAAAAYNNRNSNSATASSLKARRLLTAAVNGLAKGAGSSSKQGWRSSAATTNVRKVPALEIHPLQITPVRALVVSPSTAGSPVGEPQSQQSSSSDRKELGGKGTADRGGRLRAHALSAPGSDDGSSVGELRCGADRYRSSITGIASRPVVVDDDNSNNGGADNKQATSCDANSTALSKSAPCKPAALPKAAPPVAARRAAAAAAATRRVFVKRPIKGISQARSHSQQHLQPVHELQQQ